MLNQTIAFLEARETPYKKTGKKERKGSAGKERPGEDGAGDNGEGRAREVTLTAPTQPRAAA